MVSCKAKLNNTAKGDLISKVLPILPPIKTLAIDAFIFIATIGIQNGSKALHIFVLLILSNFICNHLPVYAGQFIAFLNRPSRYNDVVRCASPWSKATLVLTKVVQHSCLVSSVVLRGQIKHKTHQEGDIQILEF